MKPKIQYKFDTRYAPFMKFVFVFLLVIFCISCKVRQNNSDGFYGSFGEPTKTTAPAIEPTSVDTLPTALQKPTNTISAADTLIEPDHLFLHNLIADNLKPAILEKYSNAISSATKLQKRPKEPMKQIQVAALVIVVTSAYLFLYYLILDGLLISSYTEIAIIGAILLAACIYTIWMVVRYYKTPKEDTPKEKKAPFTAGDRGGRASLILTAAALVSLGACIALINYGIAAIFLLAFLILALLATFVAIGTLRHHRRQKTFRGKSAAVFSLVTSSLLLLAFLAIWIILIILFSFH
jgi:hypothetical protein